MIKLTDSAKKELKKNIDLGTILKVVNNGYGWGGPRLGLVKAKEESGFKIHEIDGFKFTLDKGVADLTDYYGGLVIDFVSMLFMKDFVVRFEGTKAC